MQSNDGGSERARSYTAALDTIGEPTWWGGFIPCLR